MGSRPWTAGWPLLVGERSPRPTGAPAEVRRWGLRLGLLLALVPGIAAAQEAAGSATAAAAPAARLEAGEAALARGDTVEALEIFRQLEREARTPRGLADLGLAEVAAGRFVDAEQHLLAALDSDGDPWISSHRPALEAALERARSRLGWLQVETISDQRLAAGEVRLGGRLAASLPLSPGRELRAPAGPLTIEVRVAGRLPVEQSVVVPAGGRAEVRLLLSARPWVERTPAAIAVRRAEALALERVAGRERTYRRLRSGAWAAAAFAGGALVGGIVASAMNAHWTAVWNDDQLCLRDGLTRAQNCAPARASARDSQVAAITLYGLAAGGAVAAALLFLLPPRPRRIPVAVTVGGGDGIGVALSGRF